MAITSGFWIGMANVVVISTEVSYGEENWKVRPFSFNTSNISTLAISVSSTINSAPFLQKAAELAKKLGLEYVPAPTENSSELVLAYTPEGLKLLQAQRSSDRFATLLFVDFVHGKSGYRLARDRSTKQAIARAAGIKPGFRPTVFDGTAGLGGDAFVLASLGCPISMCERSPIVASLLADGLQRARQDESTVEIAGARIQLIVGDSREILSRDSHEYHTIYLDPMYPHRRSSALNSQAMRALRTIVGDDQDCGALLKTALEKAKNRVVVKRPASAPTLTETVPSHVIAMKNSRFDIYLTFNS